MKRVFLYKRNDVQHSIFVEMMCSIQFSELSCGLHRCVKRDLCAKNPCGGGYWNKDDSLPGGKEWKPYNWPRSGRRGIFNFGRISQEFVRKNFVEQTAWISDS
jgi:hypothetical protein